jgi:hypothetical protein
VPVSSIKHSRLLSLLSKIQGCCLLYQTFKAVVSSIKHSGLLSPLSNIQGCCLLYQTFKPAVSSIKHSRLLSPLSNIQGCCLLYQILIYKTYIYILHFTFLFSLFVFVSAAGHYFRIWTGSTWTGQVPALFLIKSII